MAADRKMTFEDALKKLEETSANLRKENITLEEAMKNFEDGIKHYDQCAKFLEEAKQKIETYSK